MSRRKKTITGRTEREHNRLSKRRTRDGQTEFSYNAQISYRNNDARFYESATNFENAQKNLNLELCNVCHRRWFNLHVGENGSCEKCHKYTVNNELNIFSCRNNMDPGPQPDVLKKLSFVEEQLIAQVHPVISVYHLKGGQFGYSGQIINFHQDITEFITHLPHSIDTISKYIFVRRQNGEQFKDFMVNRDNVKSALIYLKNNNPWYRDIIIEENNLQNLPDNASIFQEILFSQEHQNMSSSSNEENVDRESDSDSQYSWTNNIYESGVPMVTFKCNREAVNDILEIEEQKDESHILPWPPMNTEPINEFTCDGYICRAFPTLFPTGKADLKDARIHTVSSSEYFKFLMMYEDGRFAQHPRFRFFAFNSLMRWTALRNGSICVKKNSRLSGIETIEQLQEQLLSNPSLYTSILSFNVNLRSSRSYWYARSRELLSMVEELGTPTIFITLSAADLYWPEIYRIIDPGYNYDKFNKNTEFIRKSKLLNSNPLIVAHFFHKRLEFFMDHFLKKYFKVKDFWYRIEFQHRGSPHMHGIFWFENAPDVCNLTLDDTARIQEIIKYFDEFISSWHPEPNQTYDVHPSKMHFSDIRDEDRDYNHLIRAVQMHSCSKGYCQRKKKNSSEMTCRFKYPKECVPESKIQFITGEAEYISKRNNPYLNSHSSQILKIWRANMDSQAIVSIQTVLMYIAKYASKSETRSEGMKDFIRETVQASRTNILNIRKVIQKILIKMCAERDYSAQEVFWILMSWPLYRSSRQFVSLNLSNNKWEQLDMNKEHGIITVSSSLDKYQKRPTEFENMSLKDFTTKIYKRGVNYSRRRKSSILKITPKIHYDASSINNEDYYKQEILLNIPWRQLNDLNPSNDTWKNIYDRNFGKDNLLRYDLEFLLQNLEDEENFDDINHIEVDQPYDWMDVAAGPNNMQEVDIGRREIDIRFNWNTISNLEVLNKLQNFIEIEKLKENEKDDVPNIQYNFSKFSFSDEQQEIINIFEKQLHFLHGYELEVSLSRIVVQGKAGSGKSTIISYFTNRLNETLGPSSYLLLAPTGAAAAAAAAAVNINGSTIHSKLHLRMDNAFKELSLYSLAQFQEEIRNCKYLLIDEVSMIGCSLLKKIDLRLRSAIPSRQDEPFGGLFVYFFGDIKQLPPVKDRPLYSDKIQGSELVLEGKLLFASEIQKYIFLSSSFRQNESQQVFRDILDRISDGECTIQDYEILMSRSIQTFSRNDRKFFDDAIRLFATNNDVKEFNDHKIKELHQPVAYIPASHNCCKAKSATSELSGGLEQFLILSIGSKVMLRSNLWVQKGLVNGALGYVHDIVYEENHSPPDQMPHVVMVRFEKYSHSTFEDSGCVPIPPITKSWKYENIYCTRKQFPLQLAFAITIHKSQGLTLDKAVVDIGDKESSVGLTYVALSRVKTLQGLAFNRKFTYDRFKSIKNSHMLECRKREEIRMKTFVRNNI